MSRTSAFAAAALRPAVLRCAAVARRSSARGAVLRAAALRSVGLLRRGGAARSAAGALRLARPRGGLALFRGLAQLNGLLARVRGRAPARGLAPQLLVAERGAGQIARGRVGAVDDGLAALAMAGQLQRRIDRARATFR